MSFDVEKKLIYALQVQGVTLVKMETRNISYQLQDFTPEKLEAAIVAAGYQRQEGCQWPDPDDGCYFVEAPDPEVVDGFVFAAVGPDEDTGTFYLEFGGY